MPYFLDSNVIIGYIFYNTDNWGNAATLAFEDSEPNHSGDTVKKECFGDNQRPGKVKTINKYISSSLRKIHFFLKKGKTLDQAIQEIKNDRIGEIIKEISKISSIQPSRSIIDIVNECSTNFQNGVFLKEKNVNDKCNWHYCNTPYKELYANLSQFIPDYDDIEVLIDAHHASLSVSNLIFISGDYGDVIPFSSDIINITNIWQIKPLGEFLSN
ncbi:hypothetical protein DSECCO2_99620 [anaerobic digester metagenome]